MIHNASVEQVAGELCRQAHEAYVTGCISYDHYMLFLSRPLDSFWDIGVASAFIAYAEGREPYSAFLTTLSLIRRLTP
jgi:hypothetical protein